MSRIAGIRPNELRRLLLRMGFEPTRRNDHWRFRHRGLNLRTKVSFGSREIYASRMGEIVADQLHMTAAEFRAAMRGNIPERFTNPDFWTN